MSRCSSHCRAPIGCPIVHVLVITFLVHVLYLIGRAVHSMCWSHYRARIVSYYCTRLCSHYRARIVSYYRTRVVSTFLVPRHYVVSALMLKQSYGDGVTCNGPKGPKCVFVWS
jgi:hypothetical protein